jgi:WD40 repeat protein
MASASNDHTLKVWDAMTGREILTLQGHAKLVNSLAINSDGTRLASCSDDGTVKVWSTRNFIDRE